MINRLVLFVSGMLLFSMTACTTSVSNGAAAEPPPPPATAELVMLAKEDLAKYKGVPATSIRFESAEEVQFSDSSLGCPQPGQSYLQVITPGWSIQLSIGGEKFSYGAANGTVVRCDGKPVVIGGSGPPPPGGGLR